MEELKNVCQYLQRMDRNGDFMDMYKEVEAGETTLETAKEVCSTTLHDWYADTLPEDKEQMGELNRYIILVDKMQR